MKSIKLLILITLSILFVASSFKGVSCAGKRDDSTEEEEYYSESESVGEHLSEAFHHVSGAAWAVAKGVSSTTRRTVGTVSRTAKVVSKDISRTVARVAATVSETVTSASRDISRRFTNLAAKVRRAIRLQERAQSAKDTVSEGLDMAAQGVSAIVTDIQEDVSNFLKERELILIENARPNDSLRLLYYILKLQSLKREVQNSLPDNQVRKAIMGSLSKVEDAMANRLLTLVPLGVFRARSFFGLGIHTASCVYPAIVSIISILVLYPGENLFWVVLNFHLLQYILNQVIGLCYVGAKNVLIYFNIVSYLCLIWVLKLQYLKAFIVAVLTNLMQLYIWSTAKFDSIAILR